MSDTAVRMEHVSKKFRKGEINDSLRDLIPRMAAGLLRRPAPDSNGQREFWALRDISFQVKRGEAFGIIGHNGAGKSTALKILSRVIRPTSGSMHIEGRLSALLEVATGFHPDLTGRENIFLNGAILGMKKREIQAKLDEIIAFSGIEEFIDTPVKRYSSGMYARLGFSVAAHVNPDVLLVDEVLSVGDYSFQQKSLAKLKSIIRGGATVLFVSHNLRTIADFCERCLFLERGRVAAVGETQQVLGQFMQSQQAKPARQHSTGIAITRTVMRGLSGPSVHFQSGERVWIDVEVYARDAQKKLSVSLYLSDSSGYIIFNTSLERLGYESFDLEADQIFRCTFELQLNLAAGTFHVSTLVFRYDTETEYARSVEGATFFISALQDVRGVVNCFPRVIEREIREGEDCLACTGDVPARVSL